MTLLRGKVIAEHGELVGNQGDGHLLARKIDPAILRRAACSQV